jgi:hypothetical protein
VIRKELFNTNGLFDENLGALQDYDMWIRLCQTTKVGVIKKALVNYYNYSYSNQISQYTDRYEKAIKVISEKYDSLISNLSPYYIKQRNINIKLLIAKKCMRNGDPFRARIFVKRALTYGINSKIIIYWLVSFIPLGVIEYVRSLCRRIKYAFLR